MVKIEGHIPSHMITKLVVVNYEVQDELETSLHREIIPLVDTSAQLLIVIRSRFHPVSPGRALSGCRSRGMVSVIHRLQCTVITGHCCTPSGWAESLSGIIMMITPRHHMIAGYCIVLHRSIRSPFD